MACSKDNGAGLFIQQQGMVIKNWKGKHMGIAKHIVQDSSTGQIALIILSLGEEGKKEVAVPANFFSVDKRGEFLVLNIGKEELDRAPAYHDSDLRDPEFVKEVYRFFAMPNPWTEENLEEIKRYDMKGA